jgi:hypothetical protein
MLEQTQDEIAIAILKKLHKSERTLAAAVSGALIQSSNDANNPNARNIKGAHFGIGCGYSYHHLPKGAPL